MTVPADDVLPRALSVLESRFGVALDPKRRTHVAQRLARLASRAGVAGEACAAELAARDPRDRFVQEALAEATVGETYFFRDRPQLAFLEDVVLAALRDEGAPPRAWSAGCATGEEAWTLATLLDRVFVDDRAGRPVVIGTDLVEARLATACEAIYGPGSLRRLDAETVRRHFETRDDGRYRFAAERLRTRVTFVAHNLLREAPPAAVRDVSLVVCRNLLIYYGASEQRAILDRLVERLAPGGWLVLGHAEQIEDERLEPVRRGGVTAWRHRRRAARVLAPPRPVPAEPVPVVETRAPPEPAAAPGLGLDAIRARADAGDAEGALALARAVLARDPSDVAARLLAAVLAERLGDVALARELVEQGLYLAPQSGALRCFAASLCERAGLADEAAAHRRVGRRREDRAAPGGGAPCRA